MQLSNYSTRYMSLFHILALLLFSSSKGTSIVYIQYKPGLNEKLPKFFLISGERANTENDFEDHSSWAAVENVQYPIDLAVDGKGGVVWTLETPESDCFRLITAVKDDVDEMPLEYPRNCVKVFPRRPIPHYIHAFLHGLRETFDEILSLNFVTWISLIVSILMAGKYCKSPPVSTGRVRVSYFDANRKAELVDLPSPRFPEEFLSEAQIFRAMQRCPEVSSFSLYLVN